MNHSVEQTGTDVGDDGMRLLPVPLDSLDFRTHNMDMYVRYNGGRAPTLYRAAGTRFAREDAERLLERGVSFLYIPVGQHAEYRKSLCARLEREFGNSELGEQERARVVRDACSKMIEDVLVLPGRAEPIALVSDLAGRFREWSEADPKTFSYMLEMSDHDFYTASHMVNVGVGCTMLAAQVRADDRGFIARVAQGGLLHDVGKRGVPSKVLNKAGTLSGWEWKLVRQHPEAGYEELRRCGGIPVEVLEMTRDHHERVDGRGYPGGRRGEDLSLAARICAVVDVFDSLIAARPYRGPMPPENALEIMEAESGTHFDPALYRAWCDVVHGLLRDDPGRAPARVSDEQIAAMLADEQKLPETEEPALGAGPDGAAPTGRKRRRFERYLTRLEAEAEYVRPGACGPVGPGERFPIRCVDISRSGLQIETPWPLTEGEELWVEARAKGRSVRWRVCVVRVSRAGGAWRAGVRLLENLGSAAA